MNKARIRSTLLAIVGALAVIGPQILNLIGTWESPKAAIIASGIAFVVALAINGKAVALINLLFPAPAEPIDTDATPVIQTRNVNVITQPDITPTKPAA